MQTSTTAFEPREDDDYAALLKHLHTAALTPHPLFTTDAEGLYDVFLGALPAYSRQHYVCRTCRHFVERFGGLVTIDESGVATSPFWDGLALPAFFSASVRAVSRIVSKARVTGVFLTSDAVLGNPENESSKGTWRHMHSTARPMEKSALLTAEQVAAEKREDYGTLCRGLAEFSVETVRQAHTLLTTGGLYRSEKCVGTARWLLDLHEAREATKHARAREHITWRAAALAPPGFCHVRSTMIGTLLEDIEAGKGFEEIKRSFDGKLHPLQYQRPQAAPTDGQLAAAEKVVEKLASSGALVRRFATLEDIADDAVWMPKEKAAELSVGSVFGHLMKGRNGTPSIDVPAQVITWDKFWRTVLPGAERIECRVPSRGNFFAFVTASNPDAPPILQWDTEASRNPVSWYLYNGGSLAESWGLPAGGFVPAAAITTQPSSWGEGREHQGNGVYVVIDGARDSLKSGLALFPEILKSEYHGIRAAMEAYSRSREIEVTGVPACGLALQKSGGGSWDVILRVTSRGARVVYKIDRWD